MSTGCEVACIPREAWEILLRYVTLRARCKAKSVLLALQQLLLLTLPMLQILH